MTASADLASRFAAALSDAQGEITDASSWPDVWDLATSLSSATPAVSPDAFEHIRRGDRPDPTDPLRSIADRAVGITQARLAIAETGSVLLIEPSDIDRAVSLLTRHLIVAVDRSNLVADLAEGFRWIAAQPQAAAYATFVTGPSRTADIERSLTIGVQGPSRLSVAIIQDSSS